MTEIMAKCGHFRTVANLGRGNARQRRITRIKSELCPDCSNAAKNKRIWDYVCSLTHMDGTPYNEQERQMAYEKRTAKNEN